MLPTERTAHVARLRTWLATHGVAATGPAWSAALAGERDLPTLYRHNMTSGATVKTLPTGEATPAAIRDGDILDLDGTTVTVTGDPVRDPETGAWWLTVRDTPTSDPRDVELSPATPVTIHPKRRTMPAWLAAAHAEYRDALAAWEERRDQYALGYATERREYVDRMMQADRPDPRPRFADHVREHAARMREDSTGWEETMHDWRHTNRATAAA